MRREAVKALASRGNPRAAKALLAALQDPEWRVRGEPAKALGWEKDPQAVPFLQNQRGPSAIKALVQIGGPPGLGAAFGKENFTPARAARLAAYAGNKLALPRLLEVLGDKDPNVRGWAATGQGQLADRQAVAPLLGALKAEKDNRVRRSGASALTKFQDPRVEPALREAEAAAALVELHLREGRRKPVEDLWDENPDIRSAAAQTLGLFESFLKRVSPYEGDKPYWRYYSGQLLI